MTDTVIKVENLSKKYIINHQNAGGYSTLRDKMTDGAKSLSRLLTPGKKEASPTREEFWALKDVSFEVKQGDRLGIIGRNGAGKSTLLKILSRITEPTSGQITIHGRVASLLEVGTGFHPELTGRENIFLNGAILGMSKVEINKKFDEIVAFAEIEKFLDTPVKRYSSGMYVRLAFAVAAHLEPETLIIDEVLAVGDIQFQKKCLGKMEEISTQGRTVLFVSHNLAAIQSLCKRGIFLHNRTIIKDTVADDAVLAYLQTLEQVTSQSLLERTDRAGRGKTRLSQILLFSQSYQTTTLTTGKPVKIIFKVTNQLPKLACRFTIYNQIGQAVTHLNSTVHSSEDCYEKGLEKELVCHIDELLLVPGRYRMNVAISSDGDGDGELQDHVEAAIMFDVEPGAIRDRRILDDNGYGNIAHPHLWIVPN